MTIYVNTDVAQAELARRISDAVDGTLTGWNAKAGTYEIDIDTNDDRLRGEVDPDDAFLFYPYLVEVEWLDPEASTAEKVEAVSAIMRALDGLGAEYVTAADFEQELPRAGRSSPSSRKN